MGWIFVPSNFALACVFNVFSDSGVLGILAAFSAVGDLPAVEGHCVVDIFWYLCGLFVGDCPPMAVVPCRVFALTP